jgi:hypothetical protein
MSSLPQCHNGPETPAHLIQECETLANHRRDTFDGFDTLTPAFDWTVHQLTRFLTCGVCLTIYNKANDNPRGVSRGENHKLLTDCSLNSMESAMMDT